MSKIYSSITELIGNTPMVRLSRFEKDNHLNATLLGKVEFFNPSGSVKDRIALEMIEAAEKNGVLKKDSVVIEPTSGNAGVSLAMVAASRGYRVVITMPDSMSIERRNLLKAYGAELVLTEGAKGMKGAISKANELAKTYKNSFIPGQFENQSNPDAHFKTTGPEIWNETDGKVDCFIAGVGTGGTITGTAEFLKKQNPDIKVIAVEPEGSPFITKGKAGPHKIQGIGAGFIPRTLDIKLCDEIFAVSDKDSYATAQDFTRSEGIFVGISSGAALYAAKIVAQRPEYQGKNIVILLPDSGDRYLSTPMFIS